MRLLSAQLDAYLADGLWLDNARHANAMARRLASAMPFRVTHSVEANAVFVEMDADRLAALDGG